MNVYNQRVFFVLLFQFSVSFFDFIFEPEHLKIDEIHNLTWQLAGTNNPFYYAVEVRIPQIDKWHQLCVSFEDIERRRYAIFQEPRAIELNLPIDCSNAVYVNDSRNANEEKVYGYTYHENFPLKLSSLIDANCEAQGLIHLQIRCPDSKYMILIFDPIKELIASKDLSSQYISVTHLYSKVHKTPSCLKPRKTNFEIQANAQATILIL